MNKITKLGVSALCGTLAATAANAGSLSVSGGADVSWVSLDYGVVGNPIGIGSNMTFSGSGELDNGSTVTLNITHTNQAAYSATDIQWELPGVGKISFDQGAGGTGLDLLDDKMPTAWEETTGTAVGTGMNTVSGVGGSTNVAYSVDSGMLPDGMSVDLAWSPKADGKKSNDKSVGGDAGGNKGGGFDIVVQHSGLYDGLNVFAGYSSIDQEDLGAATGNHTGTAIGATYAMGSVTVGYQQTVNSTNLRTSTDHYVNDAYGISFSVNDDLSISYGHHESERHMAGSNATLEASSIQMAYSMGGASLKIAQTSVDHANYDSTTATDREGYTVALSLAF